MQRIQPFRLMNTLFIGLVISVIYGLLGMALLVAVDGKPEAQRFLLAYTTSFRTLVSLGLIAGTALVVFRSQNVIPRTIEAAFADEELTKTEYFSYKDRFMSVRRSTTFAAQFIVIGFVLFSYSHFPLPGTANALMVIAACAQYGLGVYVGRKLFYTGMMLHSLLRVPVARNLFKSRELDDIDTYVHIASTLTVIFVYIHVVGYYNGPFMFDSFLGASLRQFLILPAIIAAPVLLVFNFYPRGVLKKVYSQSIDLELKALQHTLQDEQLTDFEKRSHLIEVDKMTRDELRYSLQLSLSDLPIGITVLIMVLQPLWGK